jgi:hypothetical protein
MITMATARSVKASVTKSPMVDSLFAGYALFNEYATEMGNDGLRGELIQIKERQQHPSHPREGGRGRVCE